MVWFAESDVASNKTIKKMSYTACLYMRVLCCKASVAAAVHWGGGGGGGGGGLAEYGIAP